MNRILVAAGTLAAVVVLGVGAVSVLGGTGEQAPGPTTASPVDASRPGEREAMLEQAAEQSRQLQAANDDLARHVSEEAARLRDAR